MHDRARIHVKAGAGGNGCLSFRREAHVPKGGPDGGDGGRGGDVVLVCEDSLRDLERFRRSGHFKAKRGGHGQGSLRHGADGETLEIRCRRARRCWSRPTEPGSTSSGRGSGRWWRGAVRAAAGTSDSRARPIRRRGLPRGACPARRRWVSLQLKLLADVGLVGLPNAGKSSLLARLTRAHPKVANYPFTTLEPVLGTLEADDRQLVIADIPGLIEGASAGAGLGHEFLAHIERTRALVHVLDIQPLDGSDPVENHAIVERELALHDPRLAGLPRVLALSKVDLVDAATAEAQRDRWRRRLGEDVPVILTSSVSREGLPELAQDPVEPCADRHLRRGRGRRGVAAARRWPTRRARRAPCLSPCRATCVPRRAPRQGQLSRHREGGRAPGGALRPRATRTRSRTSSAGCVASA